jgi:hypothetical protein
LGRLGGKNCFASRTLHPGETQQFLTRAHWPDGRIRDVTWLAPFFSNDQTVATVTPDGLVKAIRPGETAIRVHFQGLVEVVRVTIPFTNTVDGWKFTRGQNPVDAPVFAKLRALNLPPSPRCDDATFLRRAMLDTLGTLPTPDEVREFVADRSPDKRNKLVDALFDRPEFADYWTLQLADLFQNRKERDHDVRGAKNVRAFHGWLHGQVAANRPWHELVREVLTANGDAVSHPEIGYYIYLVGEKRSTESDVTDAVAQAFMIERPGAVTALIEGPFALDGMRTFARGDYAAIAEAASAGHTIALTGGAALIVGVRALLRARGLQPTTKTYWAPARVGLD